MMRDREPRQGRPPALADEVRPPGASAPRLGNANPSRTRGPFEALRRALPGIVAASLVLGACAPHEDELAAAAARGEAPQAARRDSRVQVPEKALVVYRHVLRTGRAPRGHVGGRVFENRERRLPAAGDYREFDIHPKVRGVNRGPERIVIDMRSRRGWYTADHYRTFIPLEGRARGR